MPEKSCQSRVHSYLINYMDEAIASYVAFLNYDTDLSEKKYKDSLLALAILDDVVIDVYNPRGLVGMFQSKGYFYWEGLDYSTWKHNLGT